MGEEGCYLKNDEYSLFFEGTGFEAVDTTGGADSFISALAVYLSEGHKLIESIDLQFMHQESALHVMVYSRLCQIESR